MERLVQFWNSAKEFVVSQSGEIWTRMQARTWTDLEMIMGVAILAFAALWIITRPAARRRRRRDEEYRKGMESRVNELENRSRADDVVYGILGTIVDPQNFQPDDATMAKFHRALSNRAGELASSLVSSRGHLAESFENSVSTLLTSTVIPAVLAGEVLRKDCATAVSSQISTICNNLLTREHNNTPEAWIRLADAVKAELDIAINQLSPTAQRSIVALLDEKVPGITGNLLARSLSEKANKAFEDAITSILVSYAQNPSEGVRTRVLKVADAKLPEIFDAHTRAILGRDESSILQKVDKSIESALIARLDTMPTDSRTKIDLKTVELLVAYIIKRLEEVIKVDPGWLRKAATASIEASVTAALATPSNDLQSKLKEKAGPKLGEYAVQSFDLLAASVLLGLTPELQKLQRQIFTDLLAKPSEPLRNRLRTYYENTLSQENSVPAAQPTLNGKH